MPFSPEPDSAPTRHDLRIARHRRARRHRLFAGGATVVALVGLAGVAAASTNTSGGKPSASSADPSPLATAEARGHLTASRDLSEGRAPLVAAPATTVPATISTPLPATESVRFVAKSWKKNEVVDAPSTVGALLASHGVHADSNDRLTVAPVSAPDARAGVAMRVTVQQVQVGDVTHRTAVKHRVVTVKDRARYASRGTAVRTRGHDGAKTVVQRVTRVDGVVTARKTVHAATTHAVNTVLVEGTKPTPKPKPKPVVVAASPSGAQAIARSMAAARGWGGAQFQCLVSLWNKESGWNLHAENASSGAYGIPQSLPGSKMASAGADWQTNAATQISWGLGYIASSYGSPCGAWGHSQSTGWY
jgi:hypothetical protein